MKRRLLAVALCLIGVASQAVRADVKPHGLFTDHMVLQRGVVVPVWGVAEPGEKITVTLGPETDLRSGTATADKDGKWRVELPKSDAGGPFDLTIAGKNTVTLTDVLVGDVWVCSGQSNMEWVAANTSTAKEILPGAMIPKLRLLTVRKGVAGSPRKELDPPLPADAPRSAWLNCTPTTASGFSAVGFYFGRQLVTDLDVPIGLIHSSWGGTPAEAWTSLAALQREPQMKPLLERWDANLADGRKRFEQYLEASKAWYEQSGQEYAQARPISVSPPGINNNNDPRFSPHRPATLFNAMIAPLVDFPIKGAIWYQGESNVGRADEYATLFPLMIKDWRAQ